MYSARAKSAEQSVKNGSTEKENAERQIARETEGTKVREMDATKSEAEQQTDKRSVVERERETGRAQTGVHGRKARIGRCFWFPRAPLEACFPKIVERATSSQNLPTQFRRLHVRVCVYARASYSKNVCPFRKIDLYYRTLPRFRKNRSMVVQE